MQKNLVITSMEAELRDWITEFLSRPNPMLNNFPPCPFAKRALLEDRIHIERFTTWNRLTEVAAQWDDSAEVALFWFTPDVMSYDEMNRNKWIFNDIWRAEDMWLLGDHPDHPEHINGVCMNFGSACLLLLQRLSRLTSASEQLRQAGYYDSWSLEDQEFVRQRNAQSPI